MDAKPSETRNFVTIMKKIKSVGLLRVLGAFALLSLLAAQGEEGRFYIKGDLGGNLTSDSQGSIRGDPAFGSIFGTRNIGFKARFDPIVSFSNFGLQASHAGSFDLNRNDAVTARVQADNRCPMRVERGVHSGFNAPHQIVPQFCTQSFQ